MSDFTLIILISLIPILLGGFIQLCSVISDDKFIRDLLLNICVPISILTFVFIIMGACVNSIVRQDWEKAKVYKTIPAEELSIIEMPNNEIQIWHKKEKLFTLASVEDYLRKDKIDHIEYRHQVVFGPDYDTSKIIFKEN